MMNKGWTSGNITCDLCYHEWIGVYHVSSDRLECPNCENTVYFESTPLEE